MKENFDIYFKRIVLVALLFILFVLLVISPSIRSGLANIINPILLAFALAYLIDPMVRFFSEKFKISRGKSILLAIIVIVLFIVFMGAIIIPGIIDSYYNIRNLITQEFDSNILGFLDKDFDNKIINDIFAYIQESLDSILAKISEITTMILGSTVQGLVSAGSKVLNFIMSFIIALYMLSSKEDLIARFKRMLYAFLNNEVVDSIFNIGRTADGIFSQFFIGKIIDSAIIGVLAWMSMLIAGIPNSMVMGLIIGVTNMIPYFGPFIGAVPCVLITLFVSPVKALIVGVLILLLQQVDGYIIGPKILGDKVGVSAFWIIIAVTIGGAVAGVIGMLLGVPVVVLIKTLIENKVAQNLGKKNMKNYCIDKLKS